MAGWALGSLGLRGTVQPWLFWEGPRAPARVEGKGFLFFLEVTEWWGRSRGRPGAHVPV